jgi:hypothetical protein
MITQFYQFSFPYSRCMFAAAYPGPRVPGLEERLRSGGVWMVIERPCMLHSFYHGPGLLAAIHTAARAVRG